MANLPLPLMKPLPSTCTLYHGDCLEVMPTLAPQSVRMVFADLPYGVLRCPWDCQLDLGILWASLGQICLPNAPKIFTSTQPFTTTLINSQPKQFRYDLVWAKHNAVGHLLAKKRPMRMHESLLVFYTKQPLYIPQMTDGHPLLPRTARTEKDKSYGAKIIKGRKDSGSSRYPVSVLSIKADGQRRRGWANIETDYFHPTQKPVALLEWLIATYTNPGDTVLDPVFGSGTTAIACARLGRNFIGIEKDATYFDVASKRIYAERERLGL